MSSLIWHDLKKGTKWNFFYEIIWIKKKTNATDQTTYGKGEREKENRIVAKQSSNHKICVSTEICEYELK